MTPTEEQIAKLPKWAQDHIKEITRERELSVRALNQYCDDSTPSPFEILDFVCTGEQAGPSAKARYIQAHSLRVKWRGVELRIDANDYGVSGKGIRLQWEPDGYGKDCAMIPLSYNSVKLVCKEYMQ